MAATVDKRKALLQMLPEPDSNVDEGDRKQLITIFRVIAASPTPSGGRKIKLGGRKAGYLGLGLGL